MKNFILAELSVPERYQLLTRVVAPRPIAWVSSLDPQGRGNLAPFSFFTVGGANPASCVICPVNRRDGSHKDSLNNIRATGCYAIALINRELVEAANQTSREYPPHTDEFDAVGLTRLPGLAIDAPGVAESPVNLECRLHQIVEHGQGPLASHYIIGEVLSIRARPEVLSQGLPDSRKLGQVARLGQSFYSAVKPQDLFELERPK